MTELEKEYKSVCNKYIADFCKKQDLEFNYWVGDVVGGVCAFGDFYFSFQDIVWDINSGQSKGLIIEWYCDFLVGKAINYHSYTKGLRMT